MRKSVCLAATTCFFLATPVFAGKLIVIGARGPSAQLYPIGMVLGDAGTVTLAQRDRIIVVDERGTRVFEGPGTIHLDRANTEASSRWKDIRSMVTRTGSQFKKPARIRTGGLRSVEPVPPIREKLWSLEWPKGGHFCFDANVGMIVERAGGKEKLPAASFTFTDNKTGKVLTQQAASGRAYFLWPDALLPTAGETRSFTVASGGKSETVTLSSVPAKTLDNVALAEFVTSRQCDYALTMFADKADQMETAKP